eukprot:TRINITY_DN14660_c0_g1_i1.p1 TRINITY_DN14660_c0_g1~~TRINITY_DN14660_c0_g1_i1.p1  ORF type:complete len:181 (-),score=42.65 TRINITY_DN14660_c0_g1_i1:9-551(-)
MLVLFALLVSAVFAETCGPKATVANEGCCANCYYDSVGVPTIGVGFNMKRSDAASVLKRYGVNITKALESCGKCIPCSSKSSDTMLSSSEALDMFTSVIYPPYVSCVNGWIPGLPTNVRGAIIDMAYNMGCAGVKQFTNMKANLVAKKWSAAATSAGNSKWCGQVGGRCGRDQACIKSGK